MRCWLQLLAFVTGISLATLTVPAEAQSITIKNARDEKVKTLHLSQRRQEPDPAAKMLDAPKGWKGALEPGQECWPL